MTQEFQQFCGAFLSDLLSFEGVNNFEIKIKIKFGEFPVYLEEQVFETFQLNI